MSEGEIGQVIDGEGPLQAVARHLPRGEQAAGVVDEHVDARLCCRDLGPDPLNRRQVAQIGIVDAVRQAGPAGGQARTRRFAARPVARDQH